MDPLTANLIVTLFIAALLAFIPAIVAQRKGRSAVGWWLFGFALAIVAIPMIFLVKDLTLKTCPACAEEIKADAQRCRYCGYQPGQSPVELSQDWIVGQRRTKPRD